MSTRATITVSDQHDSFDIYQHNDGYPDGPHGLVRHISMAQNLAWDLPRFEAADFAAAIIAVLKDRGGSTYLTKDAEAHSDRAFHYHITPIRENVATQVLLTITQPSWRKNTPDIELYKGSIAQAVQKFDAAPDTKDQPRELQILDMIDRSLWRTLDEIDALCGDRPDLDTTKNYENSEQAGRELMQLRHHLETANPWEALSSAETVLADPDKAGAKGYTSQAKFSVFAAMDAHRRFQKK